MAVSEYSISRASPEEGVRHVVRELVPDFKDFKDEDITIENLNGGITNILFCVSSPKLAVRDGEIPAVVRLYGNNTEAIIDRKKELAIHTEASKRGLGSTIYGSFKNGFVHGFISGKWVEIEELHDPHILELIAIEVSKWHTLDSTSDPHPTVWNTIRKFSSKIPHFEDPKKQKILKEIPIEKLKAEIGELEKQLSKNNSPVVFCHNDLLNKNIIINRATDNVSFIDYEYASYNPRGFDIGNFFNEFAGFEADYTKYPNKQQQYTFFRYYLKASNVETTEENLHKLYLEANQYALASHLLWGFWSLIQAESSDIDFGFLEYGVLRFKQYWAVKDEYLSLK